MGKKKLRILCGVLAGALLIGGAFAYFSGRAQTAENNFNIVKGGDPDDGDPIVINEPAWNAENAVDVEPGQIIAKDPSVESLAEYDGWVIVKVSIPSILAQKEGDEEYKVYDVFTLEGLNETDFTLLDSAVSTEAGTNSVYYYGYNTILASKAETSDLFSTIQMQNFKMVKENLADSVDLDAAIVQKINPEDGVVFDSVNEAFSFLGGAF